MKQFYQKPYKVQPEAPPNNQTSTNKSKAKAEKVPSFTSKPLADMDKNGLVCSMAWYHPMSTLDVGTLSTNTKRVFMSKSMTPESTTPKLMTPKLTTPESTTPESTTSTLDRPDLQQQVMECMQEATWLTAGVKRKAQRLIGQFIETLQEMMNKAEEMLSVMLHTENKTMSEAERFKVRKDAISDDECKILDNLCDWVKPKDDDGNEVDSQKKGNEDNSDINDKSTNQAQFLHSFLTYLYSGNYPKTNARIRVIVNTLIDWLVNHEFYDPPRKRGEINATMPFTPNHLVRSVSGQVAAEFKQMYTSGTHELYKKVKIMKEKGTVGVNVDIQIWDDISAIENFVYFNKLTNNSRRIIPLTASQQPFISFSEWEIAAFFWKRDPLKERLIQLALQDKTCITSINDIDTWISGKEPGAIIQNFICAVVPQGLTSRKRKKAGHQAAVKMLSLDDIRTHLGVVKSPLLIP
ncbi:hypothetical protein BGZ82_001245, partial [Podila clonocystis]